MIRFFTNEAGVLMFTDDTYLSSAFLMIERPASDEDKADHPETLAVAQAVASAMFATTLQASAPAVDPLQTSPEAPTASPIAAEVPATTPAATVTEAAPATAATPVAPTA